MTRLSRKKQKTGKQIERYEVNGDLLTQQQFDALQASLQESNRTLVFIDSYVHDDGSLVNIYKEMTEGQYADHMAGFR